MSGPGMIPLAIPEIIRLLTRQLATPGGHAERWANWRPGRQARARRDASAGRAHFLTRPGTG